MSFCRGESRRAEMPGPGEVVGGGLAALGASFPWCWWCARRWSAWGGELQDAVGGFLVYRRVRR